MARKLTDQQKKDRWETKVLNELYAKLHEYERAKKKEADDPTGQHSGVTPEATGRYIESIQKQMWERALRLIMAGRFSAPRHLAKIALMTTKKTRRFR